MIFPLAARTFLSRFQVRCGSRSRLAPKEEGTHRLEPPKPPGRWVLKSRLAGFELVLKPQISIDQDETPYHRLFDMIIWILLWKRMRPSVLIMSYEFQMFQLHSVESQSFPKKLTVLGPRSSTRRNRKRCGQGWQGPLSLFNITRKS